MNGQERSSSSSSFLKNTANRYLSDIQFSSNGTGLTPTPTNAEPVSNGSPKINIKAPVNNLTSTLRYSSSISPHNLYTGAATGSCISRPCLAGTQTVQHYSEKRPSNMQLDCTDELNDSSLLSTAKADLSENTSGIGSLVSDSCSRMNLSELIRPSDHSLSTSRWHDSSYESKPCDDLLSESYEVASPILSKQYARFASAFQRSSDDSSTESKHSLVDTDGVSKCASQSNSISHTIRQSQLLEENMASVARYVEELTGCGSSSCSSVGTSTSNNTVIKNNNSHSSQCNSHHGPKRQTASDMLHFTRDDASSEHGKSQPLSQQLSFQQLQYLGQQLSLLNNFSNGKFTTDVTDELRNYTSTELLLLVLLQYTLDVETLTEILRPNSRGWSEPLATGQSHLSGMAVMPGVSTSSFVPSSSQTQEQGDRKLGGRHSPLHNEITSKTVPPCYAASSGANSTPASENEATSCQDPAYDRLALLQQCLACLPPATLNTVLVSLLSSSGQSAPESGKINPGLSNNTNMVSMLTRTLAQGGNSEMLGEQDLFGSQQQPQQLNKQQTQHHTSQSAAMACLLGSLQAISGQCNNNPNRNQFTERNTRNEQSRSSNYQPQEPNTSAGLHRNVTNINSLADEVSQLAAPYQQFLATFENDIERAANMYRNSASTIAQKSEAAYHWSGKLPMRIYRSMSFSRKVFLGGVPWDSTSEDLVSAFSRFGNISVMWPQKEGGSGITPQYMRSSSPKGYCYIIFEHESCVGDLLHNCVRDPATGGDYYKLSSPKFKSKDVQVIPWVVSESQYSKSGPCRQDTKRTVFIGALHGMITAEALVTIMNDLFGNVVFAALDTDKYKYPIGSGRVTFSSDKSYMRAVTANFVDIRTSKFIKTIQIDPYLEDSPCNNCKRAPGIYFCRAFECFRYFCPACWQLWHSTTETLYTHKPLRRTLKSVTERQWLRS